MKRFTVGDTFGSIVITKHTEKQVYFKSVNSNKQETYKRVFHDEDGTEVLIIGDSVLDYFNIPKDDDFFKLSIGEPAKGNRIEKDKIYYTIYADAKEKIVQSTEQIEEEVKTMEAKAEVLSVEYSKALSLNRKIKASAQILADVIFELGSQLKEMRDSKLYKELGYNSFKDYCKSEIGLADRQSRAYITIAENLGSDEKWQSTAKIGVQKLEIISRLDEDQREQLQETVDLESITVKQLQEEVKKLKAENTELKETVSSTNDLVVSVQNANAVLKAQNSEKVKALNEQIEKLENQVEELENRPIEVAVDTETSREISNLKREIKAREESIKRLTREYNQLEDDMTTATQNAYKQGLEASKNNNCNQNAVFEIVTDNFEDAFLKYFSVIRENKSPKEWAERIKSTMQLFDDLKNESLGGKNNE